MRRGACLLILLALTGCSGGVDLGSPDLSATDRATCERFLKALPATLAGQQRRDDVGAGLGAAYGDPAIVVRCGAETPDGFDPEAVPDPDGPAPCISVDDVGWFLPPDEVDGDKDATFTAVSYAPRVSVLVPTDYLPEGSAAALAELAPSVTATLKVALTCS